MPNSVYKVNKGINTPIEFKGLKAQYIWYLGGGICVLLVAFAILYICGLNPFVCVAVILISGAFWVMYVYRISAKYGEHGMMKRLARKRVPAVVATGTRLLFTKGLTAGSTNRK